MRRRALRLPATTRTEAAASDIPYAQTGTAGFSALTRNCNGFKPREPSPKRSGERVSRSPSEK